MISELSDINIVMLFIALITIGQMISLTVGFCLIHSHLDRIEKKLDERRKNERP